MIIVMNVTLVMDFLFNYRNMASKNIHFTIKPFSSSLMVNFFKFLQINILLYVRQKVDYNHTCLQPYVNPEVKWLGACNCLLSDSKDTYTEPVP